MNVLIIRLSSIGDVTMTIPVIDALSKAYPEVTFTVISQGFLSPLFDYLPDNVHFIPVDTKKKHKGVQGVYTLFKELKPQEITHVADLHDVVRSKILRFLFWIHRKKTAHIDKGRQEKKQLTRQKNKKIIQLKSTFVRYQEVFEKLGFSFSLEFTSIFNQSSPPQLPTEIIKQIGLKKDREKWIGIAPFAKHQGKIYPLSRMEQIIDYFCKQKNVKLFLFGNGKIEQKVFNNWEKQYPNVFSVTNLISGLQNELVLMSHLDVMLSMDSANMHLASLVHIPVVSVWGGTHPFTGFYGWGLNLKDAVGLNLSCRPCSVYGNKPCFRNDYACLTTLSPDLIINTIEKHLS